MDISGIILAAFGVEPLWLAVICILVFLAGFVDAIAGGGGLISLPAFLITGIPAHVAIATNKMQATMGTCMSTFHYAKAGFINLRLALPAICFAIVGSAIGAKLLLLVDDSILKILLIVILPITAFYVLRSKAFDAGNEPLALSPGKTTALCCCLAFVIGIYDGFYGPGTGVFLMLGLTGAAHLRLDAAAGITKSINLTTNLSALAVFLFNGQVIVALGLLAGCFSIAGNYFGSHQFTKSGGAVAKPIIITVLVIFFVKVGIDLLV